MDFDLIIVGGGPVGATLARAASGALSTALVAHEQRFPLASAPASFDARVYALSPGNVEFLRDLGVWQGLAQERLTPVHAMQIFGDDGVSRLTFDAYRAGAAELAWIVEDAALQDALWRRLDAHILAPAQCERIRFEADCIRLRLSDDEELTARLIVGADGASSFVRREAGIEAAQSDYGQAAVVASFRCQKPHANSAFQWFDAGTVLALLPMPDAQVSMVWSLPVAEASRIAQLAPAQLCREVERASRQALGSLELSSPQRSYPLRRLAARRMVARRMALVGDAAHVIHPLAGQGLNLGLQDARELAAVLLARAPLRDPGELSLLRRYERARAEPILAMDNVVDGLYALFQARNPLAARLRNAGLNLTERLPVVKNILMRQAMR